MCGQWVEWIPQQPLAISPKEKLLRGFWRSKCLWHEKACPQVLRNLLWRTFVLSSLRLSFIFSIATPSCVAATYRGMGIFLSDEGKDKSLKESSMMQYISGKRQPRFFDLLTVFVFACSGSHCHLLKWGWIAMGLWVFCWFFNSKNHHNTMEGCPSECLVSCSFTGSPR